MNQLKHAVPMIPWMNTNQHAQLRSSDKLLVNVGFKDLWFEDLGLEV